MSISVVMPSYRNPEYLDLALKSATENKVLPETEILVVLDGYAEESEHVIKKYPGISVLPFETNQGQTKAHNTGVALASNEAVLIVNDDNVFPRNWDSKLHALYDRNPGFVWAPNQIEPSPSIFSSFIHKNFGITPQEFQYDEFLNFADAIIPQHDAFGWPKTGDGQTWPVFMSKKWYMILGGVDPYFPSPAVADWDFFMRCELAGLKCYRSHLIHFYHFAGAATKRSPEQAQKHAEGEMQSFEYFQFKWGFVPQLGEYNSKKPHTQFIRGVQF